MMQVDDAGPLVTVAYGEKRQRKISKTGNDLLLLFD
jgi:hypothetical protein